MGKRTGSERRKLQLAEVVREGFSTYRANFWLLVGTALIVFIPVGFLDAVTHGLQDLDPEGGFSVPAVVGAAGLITLTATAGEVFYSGVVAGVVGRHRDPEADASRRMHEVAEIARDLPVARLTVIDVLFVFAVVAGLLLLIVPGVIVFTWFALAAPVAEIERVGVREAFARSRYLVRGSFWRVLAMLAPVLVVGDQLGEWILGGGVLIGGEGFAGHWIGAVLSECLTAPFFALAAVVTTHQLIDRHG
jgi:hypothetical protein